jgi:heme exporter protein B
MNRALAQIFLLVAKDLRIEARSRQTIGLVVVLGLLIVVVLGLGLGAQENVAGFSATAVLWVAYLFAGVLCFEKTMSIERADGAMSALLLAPMDRGVIYVAKLIANLLLIAAVALVVTPAGVLFFNFDLSEAPWIFTLIVALSMIGFAAIGTLFAAVISSSRLQGGLLSLMIFPVTLPLVIVSTRLLAGIFRDHKGVDASSWGILVAFDVIFLAVSWIVFEFVLEA